MNLRWLILDISFIEEEVVLELRHFTTTVVDPAMAFLFVTTFYLTILLYSISSHSSDRDGDTPEWHYQLHGGFKLAPSSYVAICNRFNQIARSQKLICLLCKGLDPSCLLPMAHSTSTTSTTTAPTSPTTTTPSSPTTTTAATTPAEPAA
ncbi:hypothetical protein B5X24_HaOG212087 [Helicoverpa armigera]|uniref:Uncharacterized protein n=1 Tax=Helicoverpa armigera TaxID=29058 RepID=A0A2W1BGQ2_HELAM|nr:hypothetical protein B5X24_HaOG212087 [Helicoverpa armigera]